MDLVRAREARGGGLRRLALAASLLLLASAPENGVLGQAETSPGFQGFYVANPTSTEPIICGNGDQFITSGVFANCCKTGQSTPCAIPTTCAQGTLSYNDGSSFICGTQFSCVTMTIYASSPFATPSARNIFCGQNWVANTVYRFIPTSTSTTSTTTAPPTSVTSSIPPPTSTSGEPASEGGGGGGGGGGGSMAWIAGAVIGPIVVIVAVGLIAFWILSKRRLRKRQNAGAGAGGGPGGYSAVPMVGVHGGTGSNSPQYPPGGVDGSGGTAYDPSKYAASPSFASGPYPAPSPGVAGAAAPAFYPDQYGRQSWQPGQPGYHSPPAPQPPQELPGGGPAEVELQGSTPPPR